MSDFTVLKSIVKTFGSLAFLFAGTFVFIF